MTIVKSSIGSFVGTMIGVWFCRWLGWIPSYDCVAEQYFAEHHREIALGLLAAGMALSAIGCMVVLVYATYRMARTIK